MCLHISKSHLIEPLNKAIAKMLSNGIIDLRKSGELKKILDRYGVKDWKK